MSKATQIRNLTPQQREKADNAALSDKRGEVAQALSQFLASTYALYQKSLFYHWNVTGPNFVGLHSLFEKHYQELHSAGDVIAERIRALGFTAPGTLAEFASLSAVPEDKKLPSNSGRMVENLLASHEICSREAREVLHIAEEAEDEVTADLMIQRMAFHDKAAWMLRALDE